MCLRKFNMQRAKTKRPYISFLRSFPKTEWWKLWGASHDEVTELYDIQDIQYVSK